MSNKAKAKNTGKRAYRKRAAKRSATPTTTPDDTALLKLAATFDVLYQEHDRLRDHWHAAHAAADRDPDHPGLPLKPGEMVDRDIAVRERRGVHILADAANRMAKRMGTAAQAVFDTPARTPQGILAKLRIIEHAYGTGDGSNDGDGDLEAHQKPGRSWLRSAIDDIERLAGGVDPVLPLCEEWWKRHRECCAVEERGKGLEGQAAKTQETELSAALDRRNDIDKQLHKTPATTPAGVLAMLTVCAEEARENSGKTQATDFATQSERLMMVAAANAERLIGGAA